MSSNGKGSKATEFTKESGKDAAVSSLESRGLLDRAEVVLQVKDKDHARSEEVLNFCLTELKSGTTYNALRMKLGLGPASIDRVWRDLRQTLAEMIMPRTEEEAMESDAALSNYMINRLEEFVDKVRDRQSRKVGAEDEHHYWRLELDAMKMVIEKHTKATEAYLKLQGLKRAEKRNTGTTIIFKNQFHVPRPGEIDVTPLADAAALQAKLTELDPENE
jgi:hypothetical protein